MIRKYIKILFAVFVSIMLLAGCFYIFNKVFPKAGPIRFPDAESISYVQTYSSQAKNLLITFNEEDHVRLIEYISRAKPTRKLSLNDRPTAYPHYMLNIVTAERHYGYYIYEEGGRVYIEVPYDGIYTVNRQLLDQVLKYHQDKQL